MQFASKTQNIARNGAKVGVRHFTKTTATEAKVAVIGAAGGIGQPLSLLMKALSISLIIFVKSFPKDKSVAV